MEGSNTGLPADGSGIDDVGGNLSQLAAPICSG